MTTIPTDPPCSHGRTGECYDCLFTGEEPQNVHSPVTHRSVPIQRLRALEALAQLAIDAASYQAHPSYLPHAWMLAVDQWARVFLDRDEPLITPDLGAGE